MGFGLIRVINKMEFLQLNELQLSKYDNHYQKLKLIFERTIELIDTHNPDEVAIEAPSLGNVQSMLVGTCARCSYGSGTREIFRLNTNLRKLKWLLLKWKCH
jgi:Holliday junction resolvasome RuvABC endonuclease subunit